MFETVRIRARAIGRLTLAAVGFALIGYATLGMYQTHQELQSIPRDPQVSYQELFLASVDPLLFGLVGVGAAVVFLSIR